MDSIIEKAVQEWLRDLSGLIFKGAEKLFIQAETLIVHSTFFYISQVFLLIGGGILFLFGLKKWLYFMSGNQTQLKGYWKENKRNMARMGLLLLICLFPNEILQFTFHYGNDFMKEQEVFQQLQETTGKIEGETMATTLVMLISSLSSLWLSLLQVIEVVALIFILFLSPLIFIVYLFKRTLFDRFIRILAEAVIHPICQTFLLYISFQLFFPVFLQEETFSPFMQFFVMVGMILFSFTGAKQVNKIMFETSTQNKKTIMV